MGQLPVAMPKTISTANRLLRSARPPAARKQAGDLLLALAAVECHVSTGRPAPMLPVLLRDLVIITTRLAGRGWLEANADAAFAFTALQFTAQPPPLPELDHILANVLSDRFGLTRPQQQPSLRVQSSPVFLTGADPSQAGAKQRAAQPG